MKLMFVCTGNLCRSPMAEALMIKALQGRDCGVEVSSTGTWAGFGNPATAEAVAAVRQRGGELARHRSEPFVTEAAAEVDLIVAMTSVHVREIEQIAPEMVDRVVMLKELCEMDLAPGSGGPIAGAQAVLSAPRPKPRRDLDLDDPIGLPASAYEKCADHIAEATNILADALCGHKEET